LTGQNISNFTNPPVSQSPYDNISSPPSPDPRTSEDCLFLDVIVPTSIFNATSAGAPVLVWIYGGGYTEGDKSGSGDPAGLVATSQENGAEGVIFVAMNYRLGLFVCFYALFATET
jgi:carboxylesterase type B